MNMAMFLRRSAPTTKSVQRAAISRFRELSTKQSDLERPTQKENILPVSSSVGTLKLVLPLPVGFAHSLR